MVSIRISISGLAKYTHLDLALLVLTAILAPLSSDSSALPVDLASTSTSDLDSSVATTLDKPHLPVPQHALDMLVFVLNNVDNPANFPVEIRVNVCSFLLQLGRHASGEQLIKVKETVQPVLESLLENKNEEILDKAIQRVLDIWS